MKAPVEADIARYLQQAYKPGTIVHQDLPAIVQGTLKCAAVLVPLIEMDDGWHLLLTRRTERLEIHKGQVSFPGGRCDVGDGQAEETALREADEEIGLCRQDVRLLGRMNDLVTSSGYLVTPVVGVIPWPYPFRLSEIEVERVFTIPLAWLARKEKRREEPFTPAGVPRPIPVIVYDAYDGEVLWGVSARIVTVLLNVLKL